MSQLPKGWESIALSELAKFIDYRGKTPKKTDSGIPLITAKNIKDGYINREPREYIAEADYDEWMTRGIPLVGDVLLTTEAPLGNSAQIDIQEKFALAQRAICFQFHERSISRFVYYFLRSPLFKEELGLNATGSTVKGIKAATLKKLEVNIPPLAEQTRIVEKLDEVLAQVDTIKARLDGIPAILKRFRQSVLAAAVSGKLTEEWRKNNSGQQIKPLLYEIETQREKLKAAKLLKRSFGKHETVEPQSNELPDGWEWVCFDQISDNENNALKAGPFGSALKKSDCTDHGYRVYGQEQVIAGDETLVSYYINEEKYQQLEACSVKSGDILISLVGTIGKVLILSDKVESGIINPRLVKLSLNSEIQRKYIKAYLDSPLAWHFFNGFSHGGTMDILNLGILRKLPIPLPPVEEQKEIVRLVDQYFAFADTIEAQVKKAQARVDKLTQSILAKAFRGELVPQAPNDEPADKLLERIAAARKEAEALAKAAKKATNL
ncbi:restriction endonuclease subunit S [Vibrio cholerae]|uniref:restriction endonuclease subunit S n=1 Tax=Vibrio cholerae TaxID=666 RepID=UPI0030808A20